MVDLTARPFYLDESGVRWVHETIDSLTLEEKVGQLFINLNVSFDEDYLDDVLDRFHVGAMRYRGADSATVQSHVRYAQSRSKVPLLIASNPEMGGFGSSNDGTFVSTHLQAGSHPDPTIAYEMGQVAGRETVAMGCNWAFAPIVDIHVNWRNTVVATRSFGNDADVVIERATRFFRGISESRTACAIKHFPGDGVDERDQHLVTTYNTLPADEWHATFGRIYRALIDEGAQSIMVGHIGAPELSRSLRPGIRDHEVLPASLSPELLQNLLRGELGFNGVVLTDSSSMVGLTQTLPRRELVPRTIAAGCDMFLFMRDPDEDFEFMLNGVKAGIITMERLHEALERILGLKASLGLHDRTREDLVPSPDALDVVGSAEHHEIAARIADKTVTLVKDTQSNLPLTPETHPRVRLYGIGGSADFTGTDPSGYLHIAREELEAAGFEVHVFHGAVNPTDPRDPAGETRAIAKEEQNDRFASKFDAAVIVANVTGFAQENSIRIKWSTPMAPDIPWYVTEVPTVLISTSLPNHLIDLPMVKTVIHAHAPTREAIRATVAKITGQSPFEGTFNENVWCDTFGTRL